MQRSARRLRQREQVVALENRMRSGGAALAPAPASITFKGLPPAPHLAC